MAECHYCHAGKIGSNVGNAFVVFQEKNLDTEFQPPALRKKAKVINQVQALIAIAAFVLQSIQ